MTVSSAVILTVGNEIISGDVENTNGSWIARRLALVGIEVSLLAALRDDINEIAPFLDRHRQGTDLVFVTGGLGGTPDDLTREAVAAAFDVEQALVADLAKSLRDRFGSRGLGDYAARWANLPRGAEPLENPLGGAPGFRMENVYVFPGLPAEMEAMYESVEARFGGAPIGAWRQTYRTGEGQIVTILEEAGVRHPAVRIGSYPRFLAEGPEVEVVLKSEDADALSHASAWLQDKLDSVLRDRS
ncbi:MAG: competence/damage-inducible protein A [Gaiellaceae bacterium]